MTAVITGSIRPEPPGALTATLAFGYRALLKIRHVPEQLFDVIAILVVFTLMFTYLFGGALAGSPGRYLLRGGVVYQAFAHAHHVVDVIAKVPVEGDGVLVGSSYLQVDLRAPGSEKPPLRLAHEQPTESLPLIGGVNGEVVHPAAMSVVTDHHRPG
jgi:hypothetical protein